MTKESFSRNVIKEYLISSLEKCHWPGELNRRETISRIRQFNREKIHAKRYTLHTVVTYNIFLPRSFVLAQGSLASCRIINNLVQEMLQVITVHTVYVSSLLGWQKKARIASDLFKTRALPLHWYISFHLLQFHPSPLSPHFLFFFSFTKFVIRNSYFLFPLEKFRVWMQIKTCEYEFMSYMPNETCITWIQNGRRECEVCEVRIRGIDDRWQIRVKLIYLDTLLQFWYLLFRVIFISNYL